MSFSISKRNQRARLGFRKNKIREFVPNCEKREKKFDSAVSVLEVFFQSGSCFKFAKLFLFGSRRFLFSAKTSRNSLLNCSRARKNIFCIFLLRNFSLFGQKSVCLFKEHHVSVFCCCSQTEKLVEAN
jgi:hypothetical protein